MLEQTVALVPGPQQQSLKEACDIYTASLPSTGRVSLQAFVRFHFRPPSLPDVLGDVAVPKTTKRSSIDDGDPYRLGLIVIHNTARPIPRFPSFAFAFIVQHLQKPLPLFSHRRIEL